MDEEQLEEVEPVVIAGAGTTPRINSLGNTANAKKNCQPFRKILFERSI